jgi:serine protease Do
MPIADVTFPDLTAVADLVRPSVVQVQADIGGGAGVVLTSGGEIVLVTNAHVARGNPGSPISIVTARGLTREGHIVRRDPARDLALLRLTTPAPELTAIRVGDLATVRPGHLVVAVGHPFGVTNAVTTGVVQSVGPVRSDISLGNPQRALPWIQADVRLAPGNSGGPLCDTFGRLLGINTMVVGGLALAVPIADVQRFIAHGHPAPTLGVRVQPLPQAAAMRGLTVIDVVPNGAAARAGLVAGDLLLAAEGEELVTGDDLARRIATRGTGEVTLDLVHSGRFERRRVHINA